MSSNACPVHCPNWCVVEVHDPEQLEEGWAWHHGIERQWETTRGAMTAQLSGTTGLDAIAGDSDVRPYVTLGGRDRAGVVLSAEIDLRDIESLIGALIELRAAAARGVS